MANSNPSNDCRVLDSMAYVVDPTKKRGSGNCKEPYLEALSGDDLLMSAMDKMSENGCTFVLCHEGLVDNKVLLLLILLYTTINTTIYTSDCEADVPVDHL